MTFNLKAKFQRRSREKSFNLSVHRGRIQFVGARLNLFSRPTHQFRELFYFGQWIKWKTFDNVTFSTAFHELWSVQLSFSSSQFVNEVQREGDLLATMNDRHIVIRHKCHISSFQQKEKNTPKENTLLFITIAWNADATCFFLNYKSVSLEMKTVHRLIFK